MLEPEVVISPPHPDILFSVLYTELGMPSRDDTLNHCNANDGYPPTPKLELLV